MRCFLPLMALGCASPDPKSGGGEPPSDMLPLPELAAEPVSPSLSASEVGAQLSAALAVPPHAAEVNAAYRMLLAQGDDICPGSELHLTDEVLHGCEAASGYSYAGVSHWFEDPIDGPIEGVATGVAGDFWITTPSGHLFEAGGHSVEVSGDGLRVDELAGSWLWEDGPDWLAEGYSGSLTIEHVGEVMLRVNGAATLLGISWSAHDLVLAERCDHGPTGSLGLRDPGGGWYELTFEDCAPCTQVRFGDTDLGETCVDFAPFVAAIEGRS